MININIYNEFICFNKVFTVVLFVVAIIPFTLNIEGIMPAYIPLGWSLPKCLICKSKTQRCKSKGLTRSVVALYHGKLGLSNKYNPAGIYIVTFIFLELILRLLPLVIKSLNLPWFDIGQLLFACLFIKYLFY